MTADPAPRRSVFAVWHWPRWVLASIAIACVIYPLTTMPFIYCCNRAGVSNETASMIVATFYAPVGYASAKVPGVRRMLIWQLDVLEALFGKMTPHQSVSSS